jgi:hypothetical protein
MMKKKVALLEALKHLSVLAFKLGRNPPGGRATIRARGNDRVIEVWWHEPLEEQPDIAFPTVCEGMALAYPAAAIRRQQGVVCSPIH